MLFLIMVQMHKNAFISVFFGNHSEFQGQIKVIFI